MADLVFDVINTADVDTRMELYKHIVLSGGSTMYRGLPSRLEADLRNRYLKDILKDDKTRLSVRGALFLSRFPPSVLGVLGVLVVSAATRLSSGAAEVQAAH